MHRLTKTIIAILLLILIAAAAGGYYYLHVSSHPIASSSAITYKTSEEAQSIYVRFDMEGYDSIVTQYWKTPSDADMAQLFQQSVQKAVSLDGLPVPTASTTLASSTRQATAAMLADVFSVSTTSAVKSALAAGILQIALYNLPPAGRDELLSQTQQVALAQEVTNVNPSKNLYDNLGVSPGASVATVETAYMHQKAVLVASTSPTAKIQLAQATYAHEVLSNTQTKARYDTNQVEPTIFTSVLGNTLYVYISKMSPTTLNEFQDLLGNASSTPGLNSMIIDMRGNIGGSLADAASLLGYFEGSNQYAFDLFSQGTYNVVRTTAAVDPLLARYTDVAVLTDDMTQSTAEILTAALKRFHLAHVVGATTRGWGTVENTFPMTTTPDASTTYALLLVHAITLRDDQQPVQGRGVDPDVSITDANWKSELSKYFRSNSLIEALKKEAAQPPIQ
jgi:C-terminal processing protease CtpA/Prc